VQPNSRHVAFNTRDKIKSTHYPYQVREHYTLKILLCNCNTTLSMLTEKQTRESHRDYMHMVLITAVVILPRHSGHLSFNA